MLNESHDNISDWKTRLAALDNLPGEIFNKNEAWEKLHQRLEQKHSVKIPLLYWSAACLLASLCLFWLLTSHKEVLQVKNNVKTPFNTQSSAFSEGKIFKKDTKKTINLLISEKKQRRHFLSKSNKANHPATNNIIIGFASGDTVAPKVSLPQMASNVASADTCDIKIVKIITRQKLRVIHLNELGQPVQQIRFAYESAGFPIKITNKDIFSASSTRHSSEHDILKINLPPQN